MSRRYPTPEEVRTLGKEVMAAYWEVRGEHIDVHNDKVMRQASDQKPWKH